MSRAAVLRWRGSGGDVRNSRSKDLTSGQVLLRKFQRGISNQWSSRSRFGSKNRWIKWFRGRKSRGSATTPILAIRIIITANKTCKMFWIELILGILQQALTLEILTKARTEAQTGQVIIFKVEVLRPRRSERRLRLLLTLRMLICFTT